MNKPLADRIRPSELSDVVGQHHLLDQGKILRSIIESKKIPNMIFYGPSGVGKTTIARIIAEKTDMRLHKLNGTNASTSDIKAIVEETNSLAGTNGILLYLDEIQYFNKKQQQTLLEHIENGNITLIASTTENPYFYVYNAVLSRSTVFEFKSVNSQDIQIAVKRGFNFIEKEQNITIKVDEDAIHKIASSANGDVRKALNTVELCVLSSPIDTNGNLHITNSIAEQLFENNTMRYDKDGEEHYDIISAYQKSMRGSDPNASLHYLARLLEAGDLPSACRRLMVCASEDVGLAYPQILPIVKSCVDMAMQLGLPEARIPLADAVVLVANAPKSNAVYNGINAAMSDVEKGKIGPIPRNLQNKHFDGEDAEIKGQHYLYPHDFSNHWVKQQYLPELLKNTTYYIPGDNKTEKSYYEYWKEIKKDLD